jgi:hypothetical protein
LKKDGLQLHSLIVGYFTKIGGILDMGGLRLSAAAVAAMALQWVSGANAADLYNMATKAPLATATPTAPATCTSIQDFFTTGCVLAWHGVRLYGTVDLGYGYETSAGFPTQHSEPAGCVDAPPILHLS